MASPNNCLILLTCNQLHLYLLWSSLVVPDRKDLQSNQEHKGNVFANDTSFLRMLHWEHCIASNDCMCLNECFFYDALHWWSVDGGQSPEWSLTQKNQLDPSSSPQLTAAEVKAKRQVNCHSNILTVRKQTRTWIGGGGAAKPSWNCWWLYTLFTFTALC